MQAIASMIDMALDHSVQVTAALNAWQNSSSECLAEQQRASVPFPDLLLSCRTDNTLIMAKAFKHAIKAIAASNMPARGKRNTSWPLPCCDLLLPLTAGEALMTDATIEHITGVIAAKGSDAWYQMPVEELLPESLRDQAGNLEKGQDTMDVW